MPKTLIGVVYDIKTLAIRRIIIPDDDRELLHPVHVGEGEAMVKVQSWRGASIDMAMEAVTNATGRRPPPMQQVHEHDALTRAMGMKQQLFS